MPRKVTVKIGDAEIKVIEKGKKKVTWFRSLHQVSPLKIERWAEWGFFHGHNFTLKYNIHNSSALCFDMQTYWKFHQLIFEVKVGLKLNFELKLRSFN